MITNIRVVGVVWERGYNRPVRGNACSRQHPYLSQRGDAGSGKKKTPIAAHVSAIPGQGTVVRARQAAFAAPTHAVRRYARVGLVLGPNFSGKVP